jgi:hypothetical protein
MSQPESRLSRAIKAAIKAGGGYCVKIHGGPTMEAGTPDILACIPCRIETETEDGFYVDAGIVGRFVGIETKMPDGGDPTPIQKHRHSQIRKAGGHVIVPRSVQDAVKALEALGWQRPTNPGG